MNDTGQSDAAASAADLTGEQDDVARLLAFLQDRDVSCPLCGYNLRNLTTPRCPECRQDLELTVGVRKLRFGWFLTTITPGLFSGIAALMLLIPIVVAFFVGGEQAPWLVLAVDGFGLASGISALALIRYRYVFIRQAAAFQRWCAVGAWAIHATAFLLLWLFIVSL